MTLLSQMVPYLSFIFLSLSIFTISFQTHFNEYIFLFSSSETLISLSGETGQQDRIQMVEWSPVDHSLAVVVANDLYFMKDALTGGKAKRLTESGKDGLVFNGIADWLYEG